MKTKTASLKALRQILSHLPHLRAKRPDILIRGIGQSPFGLYGPAHPVDGGDYASLADANSPELVALLAHCYNEMPDVIEFLQSIREAVDNSEESLEGLIELRGWLADRLPRKIRRLKSVKVPK